MYYVRGVGTREAALCRLATLQIVYPINIMVHSQMANSLAFRLDRTLSTEHRCTLCLSSAPLSHICTAELDSSLPHSSRRACARRQLLDGRHSSRHPEITYLAPEVTHETSHISRT